MLYVVIKGKKPGIYASENEAKSQIEGVEGGKYEIALTENSAKQKLLNANIVIESDQKSSSNNEKESFEYYVVAAGADSKLCNTWGEAEIASQCVGGALIKGFNNKTDAELFMKTKGVLK